MHISLKVQPAVPYNESILVLLSRQLDDSSDSYINIAQISWTVSKVAIATLFHIYLSLKLIRFNFTVLFIY